jgi:hypothetical protein
VFWIITFSTFTSRYSDFDGYWLFGFLVEDIQELQFDLIGKIVEPSQPEPIEAVRYLAVAKFREQLGKAGLPMSCVRDAYLVITKSPNPTQGYVNGRLTSGHTVEFMAKAATDLGKLYERRVSKFVAPHNPAVEHQSSRYWSRS